MSSVRYPESGIAYRDARKSARTGEGKRVTQKTLAAAVGTDPRHIIRIENGEHRPRPDLRDRIADFLGVDPSTLPAAGEDPFALTERGSLPLSSPGYGKSFWVRFTDWFKRRSR